MSPLSSAGTSGYHSVRSIAFAVNFAEPPNVVVGSTMRQPLLRYLKVRTREQIVQWGYHILLPRSSAFSQVDL